VTNSAHDNIMLHGPAGDAVFIICQPISVRRPSKKKKLAIFGI
jgi:hypothetical protein